MKEEELFQEASDYQFKEKNLKKAYLCYHEYLEQFPTASHADLARLMISSIEREDEEIKTRGRARVLEEWRAEIENEEMSRVQFANSFKEFYEYDVVSVINQEHGLVDKAEIKRTLMEHARQGWKLHTMYSNELGKNALRILGFGTNSTACEDVMIFERRVERL